MHACHHVCAEPHRVYTYTYIYKYTNIYMYIYMCMATLVSSWLSACRDLVLYNFVCLSLPGFFPPVLSESWTLKSSTLDSEATAPETKPKKRNTRSRFQLQTLFQVSIANSHMKIWMRMWSNLSSTHFCCSSQVITAAFVQELALPMAKSFVGQVIQVDIEIRAIAIAALRLASSSAAF